MAQKIALGKGLASLLPSPSSPSMAPMVDMSSLEMELPPTPPVVESPNRDRHLGISMASVEEIHTNPFQPRREFDESTLQELAQSIQTSGIIQPLVVRKANGQPGFELIAGERRLRAAKIAGLKQVPIVIRRSTDRESLELALIENIQRQNLNCIDEALAYFQLLQDFSLTQEEVASRVGKDRATVANFLRLLRLSEEIIADLKSGLLSFGHGKALLGLADPELRLRARKQILEKHLSVRDAEALVEHMKAGESSQVKPNEHEKKNTLSVRFDQLSKDLGRVWSTRVEVKGSERKGKIILHYSSRQDLDRLLEDLQGS